MLLCEETRQCTADILIPHERAITLCYSITSTSSLTDGADLRSKGQSRSHRHSAEMGNVPQLTNRSVHHIKHHKRHTYRNAKVTKSTYICPSACATWAYNNNEMTSCIQTLALVRCEYFQVQNPSSRPMFGGCDRKFVNGFQIGTMEPKVMKVEYASGQ